MAAADSHCTGGPSKKLALACGAGGPSRHAHLDTHSLGRRPGTGSGIGWRGARLAAAARAQVDLSGPHAGAPPLQWRELPVGCGWRWLALGRGRGVELDEAPRLQGEGGARGAPGAPSRRACWPSPPSPRTGAPRRRALPARATGQGAHKAARPPASKGRGPRRAPPTCGGLRRLGSSTERRCVRRAVEELPMRVREAGQGGGAARPLAPACRGAASMFPLTSTS